jgi:hypothetical protein
LNVRDQFDRVIRETAKRNGWLDSNGGVIGNLSDESGILNPVEQNVKQILMDKELKNEEKMLQVQLSKQLDCMETNILTDSLCSESKKKRGARKAASNTSPSLDDILLEELTSMKKRKQESESGGSNVGAAAIIEHKLKLTFETFTPVMLCANCNINNVASISIIQEITIPVIVDVYCTAGKRYCPDYFKAEFTAFGLPKLDAHKIYMHLKQTVGAFNENEEEFITPR